MADITNSPEPNSRGSTPGIFMPLIIEMDPEPMPAKSETVDNNVAIADDDGLDTAVVANIDNAPSAVEHADDDLGSLFGEASATQRQTKTRSSRRLQVSVEEEPENVIGATYDYIDSDLNGSEYDLGPRKTLPVKNKGKGKGSAAVDASAEPNPSLSATLLQGLRATPLNKGKGKAADTGDAADGPTDYTRSSSFAPARGAYLKRKRVRSYQPLAQGIDFTIDDLASKPFSSKRPRLGQGGRFTIDDLPLRTSSMQYRSGQRSRSTTFSGSSRHNDFLDDDEDDYEGAYEENIRNKYKTKSRSTARKPRYVEVIDDDEDEEEEEDQDMSDNESGQLRPSRFSGGTEGWSINQPPPTVPTNQVSDAALLKRGLTRGSGPVVVARGLGASDPENLRIVKLRESGISFHRIKEIMNDERISKGRKPTLSVDAVTSRYNRTAPVYFASHNIEFVPLSERAHALSPNPGKSNGKPKWTKTMDVALVELIQEYDAEKYSTVAERLFEKTGVAWSAQDVAARYPLI